MVDLLRDRNPQHTCLQDAQTLPPMSWLLPNYTSGAKIMSISDLNLNIFDPVGVFEIIPYSILNNGSPVFRN